MPEFSMRTCMEHAASLQPTWPAAKHMIPAAMHRPAELIFTVYALTLTAYRIYAAQCNGEQRKCSTAAPGNALQTVRAGYFSATSSYFSKLQAIYHQPSFALSIARPPPSLPVVTGFQLPQGVPPAPSLPCPLLRLHSNTPLQHPERLCWSNGLSCIHGRPCELRRPV